MHGKIYLLESPKFVLMIKTKKPANESITFRINYEVLEKMSTEAERQGISINNLVNQVLTSYSEWDISAVSAGWAVIPKEDLKAMVEGLSDEMLTEIAKKSAERTKGMRLFMTNNDDLEGFLFILRHRCKKSNFHYRESRSEREIKIIIQHEIGRNWSFYSKMLYDQIINDVGHRVESDFTNQTVMLNIKI